MSADSFRPFDLATPLPPQFRAPVLVDCSSCSSPGITVAAPSAIDDGFGDWGKGTDFRHFQRDRAADTPTVATVAGFQGVGLPWAAGLSTLRTMAAPDFMPPEQWDSLVFVALRLSEQWGEQAHAAGWSTLDLFGCNPKPWLARADRDGLAMLLAGWAGPIRIVGVDSASVALEAINGSRLRYGRFDRSAAVPLWEGFAMPRGP